MLLKTLLPLCLLISACRTFPKIGYSAPPDRKPAYKPSYKPSYLPSCVELIGGKQPTLLDQLLDFFNVKKAISVKCQNITTKVPEIQKMEKKIPSSFKLNYDVTWDKNNV